MQGFERLLVRRSAVLARALDKTAFFFAFLVFCDYETWGSSRSSADIFCILGAARNIGRRGSRQRLSSCTSWPALVVARMNLIKGAISGDERRHPSGGEDELGRDEVIGGHPRSSEVIRGHPRSSEVIRGHQRSSEVIRGHQRSSEVIRGHQRLSAVISGSAARTAAAATLSTPSVPLATTLSAAAASASRRGGGGCKAACRWRRQARGAKAVVSHLMKDAIIRPSEALTGHHYAIRVQSECNHREIRVQSEGNPSAIRVQS